MINVFTHSYTELFRNYPNISMPDYQRPYRWSPQKLEDLLSDLQDFFLDDPRPDLHYYLGTILIYKNKAERKYEVIDGQQRLTTLILLEYVIEGVIDQKKDLEFNSAVSARFIHRNIDRLEKRKELLNKLNECRFFDRIDLTVIETNNEDNAFAFFDSQNNRGVTLGADDFLKAYHLRAVASENLQGILAQQWEKIVFESQKRRNEDFSLLHLFSRILYRARQWRGNKTVPENKDAVLETFQRRTVKAEGNEYVLYPGRFNQRYQSLIFDEKNGATNFRSNNQQDTLPFSIRQPIFKGHHFFTFTRRYRDIHELLFWETGSAPAEVLATRAFLRQVYTDNMSVFLRRFMQLCLVTYYDCFEDCQLHKAVQYFDHFIGSLRMAVYYVRSEAVKNSLINDTSNLLDVIIGAYRAQEIFDFISGSEMVRTNYVSSKTELNTVRVNYRQRVLDYYGKTGNNLNDRLQWIESYRKPTI